jgi:hypothetical protein
LLWVCGEAGGAPVLFVCILSLYYIYPYPQKNKKQFIHFKNAKEREPKERNTSKLKQVFAIIFITSVPNLKSMIYSYK